MRSEFRIDLFDLVTPIARVVDVMSAEVNDHHLQVAYLAFYLAKELDLPETEAYDVTLAGALHDIGAFSLEDRLDLLEFEDTHPGEHSIAGYILLRDFQPFVAMADLIRFHHLHWKNGEGAVEGGVPVPEGSHLIHLADRVAVQVSRDDDVLDQLPGICEKISRAGGDVFIPRHVDALLRLSEKDHVWTGLVSEDLAEAVRRSALGRSAQLDLDQMLEFSKLLCRIIDFRSEFTATHSSGVAATAVSLADYAGFSDHECKLIEIAGYLHDLGKLAVPSEILEKPGDLTDEEWPVMRSHAYFSYQILDLSEVLDVIKSWGALHQERLDGSGYPFGYSGDELSLGTRILAVSDVFTALTEDRPYRVGMQKGKALNVLKAMARNNEIDGEIVRVVEEHFDELNEVRDTAQSEAVRGYREFQKALHTG
jgi:HD-GYP domain-containing protein (c-di-GMP phosphodiesterase class II)